MFLQNEIILALCWTLIHSIWQGLLLAVVTGAVMLATRRSHANKRYRLLTMLFFVFIGVTLITFVKELKSQQANVGVITNANPLIQEVPYNTSIIYPDSNAVAIEKSLPERFKEYFDTHASLVVMIWFIIFIARFIKLTADLLYVQRLKHYKTAKVPVKWNDKLDELIQALGIRKHVQLLESGIVKVPVVMGVLKPVILLPLGLLSHLPQDEIEAILLHELAHIQRRDYFVNILQSFAETVFFFNPALMWLSSMIREERENCCDDIAISVTNSKSKFINALISFQEYNYATISPAMSFPGKKNQLLNRVKRIINNKNKTLNATEKSILTLGMGVLIMFSFVAAKKIPPPEKLRLTLKTILDGSAEEKAGDVMSNAVRVPRNKSKKENTISSFDALLYSPAIHEMIDTTPRKIRSTTSSGRSVYDEVMPLKLNGYSTDDSLSNLFTRMTVEHNKDDKDDVLFISTTGKDGNLYNFRKVKGVLTELFVNTKPVLPADFSKYEGIVNEIERVAGYRQLRSIARHQESQLRQLATSMDKLKNINEDRKRSVDYRDRKQSDDDYEKLQAMLLELVRDKNIFLEKRNEAEDRLLEDIKTRNADVIRENSKARRFDLELRMDTLRRYSKKGTYDLRLKMDTLRRSSKKRTLDLKWEMDTSSISAKDAKFKLRPVQVKPDVKFRMDTAVFKKNNKFSTKGLPDTLVWRKEKGDSLAVSADKLNFTSKKGYAVYGEVVKYSDLSPRENNRLGKQQAMRLRASEDDVRLQESAKIIRSIIKDLETEGIMMDLKTAWFALDNDQFIVDGKKISEALHEKFRNKYIKSKDGWGYYYGPIQVRGRGIFMDYRDVVK